LRELQEETNGIFHDFSRRISRWYSYDLPAGALKKYGKALSRIAQKWFALRFRRRGKANRYEPSRRSAPEFDAWRWEEISRLTDLIVAVQAAGLRKSGRNIGPSCPWAVMR